MVEQIGEAQRFRNASSQGTTLDAQRVMVSFSPEVLRGLSRLEAAVHKSKHFSPDILLNLQEATAGKPTTVECAITAIAFFTKEAMKHISATGDGRAKEALDDLHAELLALNNTPPLTLTEVRVKLR